MTKKEFDILRFIIETDKELTQRSISAGSGHSLGTVNAVLNDFIICGFLDDSYQITDKGLAAMKDYKVDNAIILAAGMSTRFVPVSYEIPKGLISVKGEILTERLIRQLHEAGITEVVLVVGYMMEKFLYLREKYGVKLVVNNEFATKNTHSSIYASRDYLANTYILCSDNYYPENMFHHYEYRAFYCSVYLPGISYVERGFVFDRHNLIVDTDKPSKDQWIMYGHAFFSREFSAKFKPILESYYNRPGVDYMYWETVYAENVKELKMWGEKCSNDQILEFDSMEELEQYDPHYIENNKVKVFENICQILDCRLTDISDIEIIKKGLNNRSFKFSCKGKEYIYRHPGVNAENVIDRKKEAISLKVAKDLGIDDTLIYINDTEGWKISRFIHTTDTFRFSDKKHIAFLARELKKLHGRKISVGFNFDYSEEADRIINMERYIDPMAYRKMVGYKQMMQPIFDWLKENPWTNSLCHNDIYEPNLLVEKDRIHLIDWEFAGDSDIGFDICKLFSVVNPSFDEIDEWLFPYFERPTDEQEKIHLFACASVIYYYWYIWGIYTSKNGEQVSEYIIGWYDKMNYYSKEVLKRIGD